MRMWVVDYSRANGTGASTNVKAFDEDTARRVAQKKLGKNTTIVRITGIGDMSGIAKAIRSFR